MRKLIKMYLKKTKKPENKTQTKRKKKKKSLCLLYSSITKLEEICLLNQNQRLIKCLTV